MTLRLCELMVLEEWWFDGDRHRGFDLPAITEADGTQKWYRNGKRHREYNRPAVIYADGSKEWWSADEEYTPKEKVNE